MSRAAWLPAILLLSACGPETAMVTASGGAGSTTQTDASTSTGLDPTTGEPERCGCDQPQVIDDDLDVAGLAALSGTCIGEVTGRLRITGVDDPAVLEPLRGLRRVHELRLFDNPALVDLSLLACLEEVTEQLTIEDNPALVDLGALSRVRVASRVALHGLPIAALPSFAPDYHGFRSLSLRRLPALADLGPVAGWPSPIDEDGVAGVTLAELPLLTSIAELAGPLGPPTPGANIALRLYDLPALTSLSGIEVVRSGYVMLSALPQVTSLLPLSSLEHAGEVFLFGMSGLSSLEGLHNLQSADDVRLTGMPKLSSLDGLRALESATHLQLGGCEDGDGLDGLADLAGLDALTTIDLDLSIVGNAGLLALSGAPKLSKAGWVDLVDNPNLTGDAVAAFGAQVDLQNLCFGSEAECGCLGELPKVLAGCPAQWSGGSAVIAAGEDGPLAGATAFFGFKSLSPHYHFLNLVILDAAADVEAAKRDGLWNSSDAGTPKLVLEGVTDFQHIIGEFTGWGRLVKPGKVETYVEFAFSIDGRLGDWATVDPVEPPRLVGQFTIADPNAATTVEGPFDAVFCDRFSMEISD